MALRIHGPDIYNGFMRTVDMTLGQGHPHHWVMDNNCVKYYFYQTSG